MDNQVWAVEYSQSQGFFQFGTLDDVIQNNRMAVINNYQRDYELIHVCRSFTECSEFAEKWYAAGYCPNYNQLNYILLV